MVSYVPSITAYNSILISHIALVTAQLAQDLGMIGQEIEKLYGVLSEEDLKLQ